MTEGSVRIQYVDFGNCEETQRSKLFRLPAELIDWPPLVSVSLCCMDMRNVVFLKADFMIL